MHPYNNHKSNLLGIASSLWFHGYSVFMFDFRSFAANPKTRQTVGYLESMDAVAAVNYVVNNCSDHRDNDPENDKQIVVMGSSMGGACAICCSESFKDHRGSNANLISAIVTDCTFSSLREICKYRIGMTSAMWFPTGLLDTVVSVMDIGNRFIYGYSVDDVSPIDVVSNESFNIPLLLLHSECDAAVPCAHSKRLYTACNSDIKNLYCIKSSDHCGGYFKDPKLFTKYLCQWVDDVLDLELRERKRKRLEGTGGNGKDSENVITNNSFIMFDTKDDIGIEEEDGGQDAVEEKNVMGTADGTGMGMSGGAATIIQGISDSNDKLKSQAVRDVKDTPPATMFGYLGSFFRK